MPKVFISHTGRDKKPFVERLVARLKARGVDVWYDEWAMMPGDSLREKINEGIDRCDYFLIVLSVRSIRSNWVKAELNSATILEIESQSCVIVPVLVGSIRKDQIPIDLRNKVYLDLRRVRGRAYEIRIGQLLKAVGHDSREDRPQDPNSRTLVEVLRHRPTDPESAIAGAREEILSSSLSDLQLFGQTYADRLRELAKSWRSTGNLSEFLALQEAAYEADRLVAERLGTRWARQAAIGSRGMLAEAYAEVGDTEKAAQAFRSMVSELDGISREYVDADAFEAVANFSFQLGQIEIELAVEDRAVEAFTQVIRATGELERVSDVDIEVRLRKSLAFVQLAEIAFRLDKYGEAREKILCAIECISVEGSPAENTPDCRHNLAACYSVLARVELWAGNESDAIEDCRRAEEILAASMGFEDSMKVLRLRGGLESTQAHAHRQMGAYSRAMPHARAGVEIWRAVQGLTSSNRSDLGNLILALDCLARLLLRAGEDEEANSVAEELLDARKQEKMAALEDAPRA